MKQKLLTLVLLLTSLCLWAQKPVILPGKGRIDLESARTRLDLNMNIDNLSLGELRVLANIPAARQGYCFTSADLRSVFSMTSWYDDLLWKRYDDENDPMNSEGNDYNKGILHLSKAEQAFVARVRKRMAELRTSLMNNRPDGYRVNPSLAVNEFQMSKYPDPLKTAIGRNGFAIVPSDNIQLFHAYEENDYHDMPSFVTTDLYLQLFHFYFDCVLRDIEEEHFGNLLLIYCNTTYQQLASLRQSAKGDVADAAAWCQAYLAVAIKLLGGDQTASVPDAYKKYVDEEVKKVMDEGADFSDFLGYTNVLFTYNLFRPRGHYTRSEASKRYFRAMMWLQTVPFGTDRAEQMRRAIVLADVTGSNAVTQKTYHAIFDPLTILMGEPDNVTILQVYDVVKDHHGNLAALFKNKKQMAAVRQQVEEIAKAQTRITPPFLATSQYKINLMPQRYQPDAEVLNEMIDAQSETSKRGAPMALDVMAAMQCQGAERILIDELGQAKQWDGYVPTLEKMKTRMGEIDWSATMATRWLSSLQDVCVIDPRMPYFMLTKQWEKKNLNTALASYAELKHDAILYAKQPAGAECGAAGPPEPITKGYVEPNVRFWKAAVTTMDYMKKILEDYGLMTEKAESTTDEISGLAEFLLGIATKEIDHKKLTDEEYGQIEIIGATIENISLDLARDKDQYLEGWDNVEGPDKSVACIADVYTANAYNIPDDQKHVVYEGVGKADDIYVLVEIDGLYYLTRGAVFSYRETTLGLGDPRMTDEEWQEKLEKKPRLGQPKWMNEILVPEGKAAEVDEKVFYSSGC